ncbi:Tripartite DNA replication factor [Tulasnella sp. 419]|nr:Tripartite DNA replication factor [Tulasnella sp. 419]
MASLTDSERSMMEGILADLDESLFQGPTPDPTPVKPVRQRTDTPSKTRPSTHLSPLMTRKLGRTPLGNRTNMLLPKQSNSKPKGITPAQQVPATKGVTKAELDAMMDGIEDWDWSEMEAEANGAEGSQATRLPQLITYATPMPTSTQPAPDRVTEPCTRCIVDSVEVINPGSYKNIKHLFVHVDLPASVPRDKRMVELKDDWVSTDVRPGDTINVLGRFTPVPAHLNYSSSITLTSLKNTLIIHPDLLLTSTAISSSAQCSRKPIITSLIASPTNFTDSTVWGNFLHEIFQACLDEGQWDKKFIEDKIDEVVQNGLGELVKLSVGVEKAKVEVRTRAVGVQAFSERFIADYPKPDAELTDSRNTSSKSLLALTGLHDVEEDIWSPTYGLKGKIDASMQATIKDEDGPSKVVGNAGLGRTKATSWTVPLEIKTGRANAGMEHRAQTMLYTLLVAERYGVEVPTGLLYYTQTDQVIRVTPSRHELRSLIVARNEIASYMMRRKWNNKSDVQPEDDTAESLQGSSTLEDLEDVNVGKFLPPTIDREWACKKCYAVDSCLLYRKAVDRVEDDTSEIADLYAMKTSHLTPPQLDFFAKWEKLLAQEEQDAIRFRKELWTMTAEERETKYGRCFANMRIVVGEGGKNEGKNVAKIHRFTYKFVRGGDMVGSLLNGYITKGDAVTVSIEPDLLALARGFVLDLQPDFVVVGLDHVLNVDGVLARTRTQARSFTTSEDVSAGNVVFRIDKDEITGGMGRIRYNLANLFFAGGDSRRLNLVVDLKTPEFEDTSNLVFPPNNPLNESQQAAMEKVMRARDYTLILGMPGTGKTTTISEIIKELVRRKKTVLLTSYTHSAVDNILAKLGGDDVTFDILRLGNVDKVHPEVRKFTLAEKATASSVEQLERQIFDPPVVATTCLSLDHALFSRRTFDYCIVDEASQITLPTCLGPLRHADKFVLVGDHFQLPPLVRNPAARKGGLDVSLFRRLSEAHPAAVVDLAMQYRMNEDIMSISNELIYGGRLKCGSKDVAEAVLKVPKKAQVIKSFHDAATRNQCEQVTGGCWMERILDEQTKVVFVDTDTLPGRESRVGELVQNEVEANLVHQVARALLEGGVESHQIGVITLYRQQIKLLSHLFQVTPAQKDIEILTADRSQGRDKDCIILSMVRSNDAKAVGELLKDWRRATGQSKTQEEMVSK